MAAIGKFTRNTKNHKTADSGKKLKLIYETDDQANNNLTGRFDTANDRQVTCAKQQYGKIR